MCSTPKATARTKRHRQAPEQSYSEYSAMITRSNVSYNKRLHEKKLIMMNSTYPHVRIAHIKHVVCPLHILALKKELDEIEVFETLRVIPGDLSVIAELTATCHSLGHQSQIIDNAGQQELYVTKSNRTTT